MDVIFGPVKKFLFGYIKSTIEYYLSKYIKNINIEALGIFGADWVLNDLELRLDVLQELIPTPLSFVFTKGSIKKLTIRIPWSSLHSSPIEVILDTVECVLTSKSEEDSIDEKRHHSLDDEFRGPANASNVTIGQTSSAPTPTHSKISDYAPNWIHNIMPNVKLSVKNLVFKYQHKEVELVVGLSSLHFVAADAKTWNPSFVALDGEFKIIHRLLIVQDLVLTIESSADHDHTQYHKSLARNRLQSDVSDTFISDRKSIADESPSKEASTSFQVNSVPNLHLRSRPFSKDGRGSHIPMDAQSDQSRGSRISVRTNVDVASGPISGTSHTPHTTYTEEPVLSRTTLLIRLRLPLNPEGDVPYGSFTPSSFSRSLNGDNRPGQPSGMNDFSSAFSRYSSRDRDDKGSDSTSKIYGQKRQYLRPPQEYELLARQCPTLASVLRGDPFPYSLLQKYPGDCFYMRTKEAGKEKIYRGPTSPVLVHVYIVSLELGLSLRQLGFLQTLLKQDASKSLFTPEEPKQLSISSHLTENRKGAFESNTRVIDGHRTPDDLRNGGDHLLNTDDRSERKVESNGAQGHSAGGGWMSYFWSSILAAPEEEQGEEDDESSNNIDSTKSDHANNNVFSESTPTLRNKSSVLNVLLGSVSLVLYDHRPRLRRHPFQVASLNHGDHKTLEERSTHSVTSQFHSDAKSKSSVNGGRTIFVSVADKGLVEVDLLSEGSESSSEAEISQRSFTPTKRQPFLNPSEFQESITPTPLESLRSSQHRVMRNSSARKRIEMDPVPLFCVLFDPSWLHLRKFQLSGASDSEDNPNRNSLDSSSSRRTPPHPTTIHNSNSNRGKEIGDSDRNRRGRANSIFDYPSITDLYLDLGCVRAFLWNAKIAEQYAATRARDRAHLEAEILEPLFATLKNSYSTSATPTFTSASGLGLTSAPAGPSRDLSATVVISSELSEAGTSSGMYSESKRNSDNRNVAIRSTVETQRLQMDRSMRQKKTIDVMDSTHPFFVMGRSGTLLPPSPSSSGLTPSVQNLPDLAKSPYFESSLFPSVDAETWQELSSLGKPLLYTVKPTADVPVGRSSSHRQVPLSMRLHLTSISGLGLLEAESVPHTVIECAIASIEANATLEVIQRVHDVQQSFHRIIDSTPSLNGSTAADQVGSVMEVERNNSLSSSDVKVPNSIELGGRSSRKSSILHIQMNGATIWLADEETPAAVFAGAMLGATLGCDVHLLADSASRLNQLYLNGLMRAETDLPDTSERVSPEFLYVYMHDALQHGICLSQFLRDSHKLHAVPGQLLPMRDELSFIISGIDVLSSIRVKQFIFFRNSLIANAVEEVTELESENVMKSISGVCVSKITLKCDPIMIRKLNKLFTSPSAPLLNLTEEKGDSANASHRGMSDSMSLSLSCDNILLNLGFSATLSPLSEQPANRPSILSSFLKSSSSECHSTPLYELNTELVASLSVDPVQATVEALTSSFSSFRMNRKNMTEMNLENERPRSHTGYETVVLEWAPYLSTNAEIQSSEYLQRNYKMDDHNGDSLAGKISNRVVKEAISRNAKYDFTKTMPIAVLYALKNRNDFSRCQFSSETAEIDKQWDNLNDDKQRALSLKLMARNTPISLLQAVGVPLQFVSDGSAENSSYFIHDLFGSSVLVRMNPTKSAILTLLAGTANVDMICLLPALKAIQEASSSIVFLSNPKNPSSLGRKKDADLQFYIRSLTHPNSALPRGGNDANELEDNKFTPLVFLYPINISVFPGILSSNAHFRCSSTSSRFKNLGNSTRSPEMEGNSGKDFACTCEYDPFCIPMLMGEFDHLSDYLGTSLNRPLILSSPAVSVCPVYLASENSEVQNVGTVNELLFQLSDLRVYLGPAIGINQTPSTHRGITRINRISSNNSSIEMMLDAEYASRIMSNNDHSNRTPSLSRSNSTSQGVLGNELLDSQRVMKKPLREGTFLNVSSQVLLATSVSLMNISSTSSGLGATVLSKSGEKLQSVSDAAGHSFNFCKIILTPSIKVDAVILHYLDSLLYFTNHLSAKGNPSAGLTEKNDQLVKTAKSDDIDQNKYSHILLQLSIPSAYGELDTRPLEVILSSAEERGNDSTASKNGIISDFGEVGKTTNSAFRRKLNNLKNLRSAPVYAMAKQSMHARVYTKITDLSFEWQTGPLGSLNNSSTSNLSNSSYLSRGTNSNLIVPGVSPLLSSSNKQTVTSPQSPIVVNAKSSSVIGSKEHFESQSPVWGIFSPSLLRFMKLYPQLRKNMTNTSTSKNRSEPQHPQNIVCGLGSSIAILRLQSLLVAYSVKESPARPLLTLVREGEEGMKDSAALSLTLSKVTNSNNIQSPSSIKPMHSVPSRDCSNLFRPSLSQLSVSIDVANLGLTVPLNLLVPLQLLMSSLSVNRYPRIQYHHGSSVRNSVSHGISALGNFFKTNFPTFPLFSSPSISFSMRSACLGVYHGGILLDSAAYVNFAPIELAVEPSNISLTLTLQTELAISTLVGLSNRLTRLRKDPSYSGLDDIFNLSKNVELDIYEDTQLELDLTSLLSRESIYVKSMEKQDFLTKLKINTSIRSILEQKIQESSPVVVTDESNTVINTTSDVSIDLSAVSIIISPTTFRALSALVDATVDASRLTSALDGLLRVLSELEDVHILKANSNEPVSTDDRNDTPNSPMTFLSLSCSTQVRASCPQVSLVLLSDCSHASKDTFDDELAPTMKRNYKVQTELLNLVVSPVSFRYDSSILGVFSISSIHSQDNAYDGTYLSMLTHFLGSNIHSVLDKNIIQLCAFSPSSSLNLSMTTLRLSLHSSKQPIIIGASDQQLLLLSVSTALETNMINPQGRESTINNASKRCDLSGGQLNRIIELKLSPIRVELLLEELTSLFSTYAPHNLQLLNDCNSLDRALLATAVAVTDSAEGSGALGDIAISASGEGLSDSERKKSEIVGRPRIDDRLEELFSFVRRRVISGYTISFLRSCGLSAPLLVCQQESDMKCKYFGANISIQSRIHVISPSISFSFGANNSEMHQKATRALLKLEVRDFHFSRSSTSSSDTDICISADWLLEEPSRSLFGSSPNLISTPSTRSGEYMLYEDSSVRESNDSFSNANLHPHTIESIKTTMGACIELKMTPFCRYNGLESQSRGFNEKTSKANVFPFVVAPLALQIAMHKQYTLLPTVLHVDSASSFDNDENQALVMRKVRCISVQNSEQVFARVSPFVLQVSPSLLQLLNNLSVSMSTVRNSLSYGENVDESFKSSEGLLYLQQLRKFLFPFQASSTCSNRTQETLIPLNEKNDSVQSDVREAIRRSTRDPVVIAKPPLPPLSPSLPAVTHDFKDITIVGLDSFNKYLRSSALLVRENEKWNFGAQGNVVFDSFMRKSKEYQDLIESRHMTLPSGFATPSKMERVPLSPEISDSNLNGRLLITSTVRHFPEIVLRSIAVDKSTSKTTHSSVSSGPSALSTLHGGFYGIVQWSYHTPVTLLGVLSPDPLVLSPTSFVSELNISKAPVEDKVSSNLPNRMNDSIGTSNTIQMYTKNSTSVSVPVQVTPSSTAPPFVFCVLERMDEASLGQESRNEPEWIPICSFKLSVGSLLSPADRSKSSLYIANALSSLTANTISSSNPSSEASNSISQSTFIKNLIWYEQREWDHNRGKANSFTHIPSNTSARGSGPSVPNSSASPSVSLERSSNVENSNVSGQLDSLLSRGSDLSRTFRIRWREVPLTAAWGVLKQSILSEKSQTSKKSSIFGFYGSATSTSKSARYENVSDCTLDEVSHAAYVAVGASIASCLRICVASSAVCYSDLSTISPGIIFDNIDAARSSDALTLPQVVMSRRSQWIPRYSSINTNNFHLHPTAQNCMARRLTVPSIPSIQLNVYIPTSVILVSPRSITFKGEKIPENKAPDSLTIMHDHVDLLLRLGPMCLNLKRLAVSCPALARIAPLSEKLSTDTKMSQKLLVDTSHFGALLTTYLPRNEKEAATLSKSSVDEILVGGKVQMSTISMPDFLINLRYFGRLYDVLSASPMYLKAKSTSTDKTHIMVPLSLRIKPFLSQPQSSNIDGRNSFGGRTIVSDDGILQFSDGSTRSVSFSDTSSTSLFVGSINMNISPIVVDAITDLVANMSSLSQTNSDRESPILDLDANPEHEDDDGNRTADCSCECSCKCKCTHIDERSGVISGAPFWIRNNSSFPAFVKLSKIVSSPSDSTVDSNTPLATSSIGDVEEVHCVPVAPEFLRPLSLDPLSIWYIQVAAIDSYSRSSSASVNETIESKIDVSCNCSSLLESAEWCDPIPLTLRRRGRQSSLSPDSSTRRKALGVITARTSRYSAVVPDSQSFRLVDSRHKQDPSTELQYLSFPLSLELNDWTDILTSNDPYCKSTVSGALLTIVPPLRLSNHTAHPISMHWQQALPSPLTGLQSMKNESPSARGKRESNVSADSSPRLRDPLQAPSMDTEPFTVAAPSKKRVEAAPEQIDQPLTIDELSPDIVIPTDIHNGNNQIETKPMDSSGSPQTVLQDGLITKMWGYFSGHSPIRSGSENLGVLGPDLIPHLQSPGGPLQSRDGDDDMNHLPDLHSSRSTIPTSDMVHDLALTHQHVIHEVPVALGGTVTIPPHSSIPLLCLPPLNDSMAVTFELLDQRSSSKKSSVSVGGDESGELLESNYKRSSIITEKKHEEAGTSVNLPLFPSLPAPPSRFNPIMSPSFGVQSFKQKDEVESSEPSSFEVILPRTSGCERHACWSSGKSINYTLERNGIFNASISFSPNLMIMNPSCLPIVVCKRKQPLRSSDFIDPPCKDNHIQEIDITLDSLISQPLALVKGMTSSSDETAALSLADIPAPSAGLINNMIAIAKGISETNKAFAPPPKNSVGKRSIRGGDLVQSMEALVYRPPSDQWHLIPLLRQTSQMTSLRQFSPASVISPIRPNLAPAAPEEDISTSAKSLGINDCPVCDSLILAKWTRENLLEISPVAFFINRLPIPLLVWLPLESASTGPSSVYTDYSIQSSVSELVRRKRHTPVLVPPGTRIPLVSPLITTERRNEMVIKIRLGSGKGWNSCLSRLLTQESQDFAGHMDRLMQYFENSTESWLSISRSVVGVSGSSSLIPPGSTSQNLGEVEANAPRTVLIPCTEDCSTPHSQLNLLPVTIGTVAGLSLDSSHADSPPGSYESPPPIILWTFSPRISLVVDPQINRLFRFRSPSILPYQSEETLHDSEYVRANDGGGPIAALTVPRLPVLLGAPLLFTRLGISSAYSNDNLREGAFVNETVGLTGNELSDPGFVSFRMALSDLPPLPASTAPPHASELEMLESMLNSHSYFGNSPMTALQVPEGSSMICPVFFRSSNPHRAPHTAQTREFSRNFEKESQLRAENSRGTTHKSQAIAGFIRIRSILNREQLTTSILIELPQPEDFNMRLSLRTSYFNPLPSFGMCTPISALSKYDSSSNVQICETSTQCTRFLRVSTGGMPSNEAVDATLLQLQSALRPEIFSSALSAIQQAFGSSLPATVLLLRALTLSTIRIDDMNETKMENMNFPIRYFANNSLSSTINSEKNSDPMIKGEQNNTNVETDDAVVSRVRARALEQLKRISDTVEPKPLRQHPILNANYIDPGVIREGKPSGASTASSDYGRNGNDYSQHHHQSNSDPHILTFRLPHRFTVHDLPVRQSREKVGADSDTIASKYEKRNYSPEVVQEEVGSVLRLLNTDVLRPVPAASCATVHYDLLMLNLPRLLVPLDDQDTGELNEEVEALLIPCLPLTWLQGSLSQSDALESSIPLKTYRRLRALVPPLIDRLSHPQKNGKNPTTRAVEIDSFCKDAVQSMTQWAKACSPVLRSSYTTNISGSPLAPDLLSGNVKSTVRSNRISGDSGTSAALSHALQPLLVRVGWIHTVRDGACARAQFSRPRLLLPSTNVHISLQRLAFLGSNYPNLAFIAGDYRNIDGNKVSSQKKWKSDSGMDISTSESLVVEDEALAKSVTIAAPQVDRHMHFINSSTSSIPKSYANLAAGFVSGLDQKLEQDCLENNLVLESGNNIESFRSESTASTPLHDQMNGVPRTLWAVGRHTLALSRPFVWNGGELFEGIWNHLSLSINKVAIEPNTSSTSLDHGTVGGSDLSSKQAAISRWSEWTEFSDLSSQSVSDDGNDSAEDEVDEFDLDYPHGDFQPTPRLNAINGVFVKPTLALDSYVRHERRYTTSSGVEGARECVRSARSMLSDLLSAELRRYGLWVVEAPVGVEEALQSRVHHRNTGASQADAPSMSAVDTTQEKGKAETSTSFFGRLFWFTSKPAVSSSDSSDKLAKMPLKGGNSHSKSVDTTRSIDLSKGNMNDGKRSILYSQDRGTDTGSIREYNSLQYYIERPIIVPVASTLASGSLLTSLSHLSISSGRSSIEIYPEDPTHPPFTGPSSGIRNHLSSTNVDRSKQLKLALEEALYVSDADAIQVYTPSVSASFRASVGSLKIALFGNEIICAASENSTLSSSESSSTMRKGMSQAESARNDHPQYPTRVRSHHYLVMPPRLQLFLQSLVFEKDGSLHSAHIGAFSLGHFDAPLSSDLHQVVDYLQSKEAGSRLLPPSSVPHTMLIGLKAHKDTARIAALVFTSMSLIPTVYSKFSQNPLKFETFPVDGAFSRGKTHLDSTHTEQILRKSDNSVRPFHQELDSIAISFGEFFVDLRSEPLLQLALELRSDWTDSLKRSASVLSSTKRTSKINRKISTQVERSKIVSAKWKGRADNMLNSRKGKNRPLSKSESTSRMRIINISPSTTCIKNPLLWSLGLNTLRPLERTLSLRFFSVSRLSSTLSLRFQRTEALDSLNLPFAGLLSSLDFEGAPFSLPHQQLLFLHALRPEILHWLRQTIGVQAAASALPLVGSLRAIGSPTQLLAKISEGVGALIRAPMNERSRGSSVLGAATKGVGIGLVLLGGHFSEGIISSVSGIVSSISKGLATSSSGNSKHLNARVIEGIPHLSRNGLFEPGIMTDSSLTDIIINRLTKDPFIAKQHWKTYGKIHCWILLLTDADINFNVGQKYNPHYSTQSNEVVTAAVALSADRICPLCKLPTAVCLSRAVWHSDDSSRNDASIKSAVPIVFTHVDYPSIQQSEFSNKTSSISISSVVERIGDKSTEWLKRTRESKLPFEIELLKQSPWIIKD